MQKKNLIYLVVLVALGWFLGGKAIKWNQQRTKFKQFRTDFSRTTIDLNDLVFGDIGKDDIPEIFDTKYVSVKEDNLKDESRGVLVNVLGRKKYYPVNILVWHEVINDALSGQFYSVTYSPFCESIAVYKGDAVDHDLKFRASGLLYKSNLVFFDTQTESLWLQATGKAIVGNFIGASLDLVEDTQVITYKDLKRYHPEAEVLSRDTGYFKNYSYNPFSGYLENDDHPEELVAYENKRFDKKEMMYVVPVDDRSLAFPIADLPEGETVQKVFNDSLIIAGKHNGGIIVTRNGKRIGGYPQLWFCWAALHEEDGSAWDVQLDLLNRQVEEATDEAEVL